jgi:hypothetical protein
LALIVHGVQGPVGLLAEVGLKLLLLFLVSLLRPATVLSKGENFLEVEYDNGER